MIRIRRTAILLSIATAVFFGAVLPAAAQFANSASLPTMGISSIDVAAPASVSTSGSTCGFSTLNLQLSWPASTTTRGVTGYRVTVYRADGSTGTVATTGSSTTTFSSSYARGYQTYRFSVTTLTSYGWTKESPLSGGFTC